MKQISIENVQYVDGLMLSLLFSDGSTQTIDFSGFFEKHPHPQYNKYKKISEFKKFWLRNGNLIWGKHADLSFPLNALYFGNLELCCDDEWPECKLIINNPTNQQRTKKQEINTLT